MDPQGLTPVVVANHTVADSYSGALRTVPVRALANPLEVEMAVRQVAAKSRVVRIFARGEGDLLTAAGLRVQLKIPGQDDRSAKEFTDKRLMKARVRAAGIRTPEFARADDVSQIESFVAHHGYPVVVKPVSKSGSLGTEVITSEFEMRAYLIEP